MSRLLGMLALIAAVIALFVGLSWAFYYVSAGLGLFTNWIGALVTGQATRPIHEAWFSYGAAIGNLLTLMLVTMMVSGSLLTVAERKWSAMMQNRIGANRIKVLGSSLGGIPFLVADALKMLTKERVEPTGRTRILYELAPVLAFAPVFALFAIVPVGPPVDLAQLVGDAPGSLEVSLQVAHIDAGLIYIFAIASLQVYGTSLAGWASNNKLALLGGVRASSQMISYEVSLGLSLVGCMLAYRTLRLDEMVAAQSGPMSLGIVLQPLGFLIFFASAFAETKRAPFDLPEGESEIVGYFVEYSGMKFGLMFLAEFVEITVLSGVVTAVFLGGWQPIVVSKAWLFEHVQQPWAGAICAAAFLVKMVILMWLQLTIRWLLPRFRYDQIQKLCWKLLLPAAVTNIFVTAGVLLLDPSMNLLAWLGIATIVVVAVVTAAVGRGSSPSPAHAVDTVHAQAGH